ncbi:macrophage mannose receptor 1 [Elysia marginata]|uniref:Macrophage mannose receptor 1 n=1 Tax=Elysia marginata TaxID=1093978 RepID=A0AAV4IZV7_9GAST|nr:macrophage mannose receptor 1 [Elysia marginata]
MGKVHFLLFFILWLNIEGNEANVCDSWAADAVYAGDGMCMTLNRTVMTLPQAKDMCLTQFGGHVAELRTEYQRQTVMSLIDATGARIVWIGASDEANEEEWLWLSNNDHAHIHSEWWASLQPDNHNGVEHCLVMELTQLRDRSCSKTYSTTCQKYIGNPCDGVLSGAEYYNGSCFKAVVENMTIDVAQDRCENMGAFLAEPNSADLKEFLALFAGMSFSQGENVLLGLTMTPPDDKFRRLSTGDSVDTTNWLIGTLSDLPRMHMEH